jgi:hypothetical protein
VPCSVSSATTVSIAASSMPRPSRWTRISPTVRSRRLRYR